MLHHVRVVPVHVAVDAPDVEAVAPAVVLEDALEDAQEVALAVVRVAVVHVLDTVEAPVLEDVLGDALVVAHQDVRAVLEDARIPANTVANGAPLN